MLTDNYVVLLIISDFYTDYNSIQSWMALLL